MHARGAAGRHAGRHAGHDGHDAPLEEENMRMRRRKSHLSISSVMRCDSGSRAMRRMLRLKFINMPVSVFTLMRRGTARPEDEN